MNEIETDSGTLKFRPGGWLFSGEIEPIAPPGFSMFACHSPRVSLSESHLTIEGDSEQNVYLDCLDSRSCIHHLRRLHEHGECYN